MYKQLEAPDFGITRLKFENQVFSFTIRMSPYRLSEVFDPPVLFPQVFQFAELSSSVERKYNPLIWPCRFA